MSASSRRKSLHELRGLVEIRWASDGDPDDVVAPWPRSRDHEPISVHIERMGDGLIWMAIYPPDSDERVVMWFTAKRRNELEWTVSPVGE